MTELRIGICGGGVGGLAAAIGLRKMGHDAVVFEKASQFLQLFLKLMEIMFLKVIILILIEQTLM